MSLHAFHFIVISVPFISVHLTSLLLVRGLPPFQRFPHEPLWLTPGLDSPPCVIWREIFGTGLRCGLGVWVGGIRWVRGLPGLIQLLGFDGHGFRWLRLVAYFFLHFF